VNPLVSILIPTYNRLGFLQTAVESCLSQSYSNVEIIISDDGSTDGTRDWGEALIGGHQVIYQHHSHRGVDALARITNEMLECAHGRYVALLDSDDYYIDSSAIETMVTAIQQYDVAMVFGSLQPINPIGQPLPVEGPFTLSWHRQLNTNSWSTSVFFKELLKRDFIPANANLIEVSALRRIGGFREFPDFPAQDYHVWLALALEHQIRWVNRVITAWRIHPGQTTSSRGMDLVEGAMRVSKYYFDRAIENGLLQAEDWVEIERVRQIAVARGCWGQIQQLAPSHNWHDLRGMAKRQISLGDTPLRIEGAVALGSSYLHWDVVTPLLAWAARRQLRVNA